ncbi:hypothetical protein K402DRAFT_198206 [Aulographum hederae CBS 113979]|uniref:Uncharacterized protein n=1 Tax=Aulographum hederae CBS 113979 TaxID=1176131 RepID=A0A6G1GN48_9PEZI|nr:hypothetical protein K402DRAFT_198206 [Aulographum hederae CBS 113979]
MVLLPTNLLRHDEISNTTEHDLIRHAHETNEDDRRGNEMGEEMEHAEETRTGSEDEENVIGLDRQAGLNRFDLSLPSLVLSLNHYSTFNTNVVIFFSGSISEASAIPSHSLKPAYYDRSLVAVNRSLDAGVTVLRPHDRVWVNKCYQTLYYTWGIMGPECF